MGKTLRIWNEFGETPKVSFIQDKRTFHYIQKKQENFY